MDGSTTIRNGPSLTSVLRSLPVITIGRCIEVIHHSTVKKLRSLLLEKEILTVYRVNCEKFATNG